MTVALLLYTYARGERSSRKIERACVEDVAVRVIAAREILRPMWEVREARRPPLPDELPLAA